MMSENQNVQAALVPEKVNCFKKAAQVIPLRKANRYKKNKALQSRNDKHFGTMGDLSDVSVVIPMRSSEPAGDLLLSALRKHAPEAEVIVVRPPPEGRAAQMNAGARQATRKFLWFLHADTTLAPSCISALQRSLAADPNALHYFDLKFAADGPWLMRVNALGVWIRSHVLGMPFGDQGFCLSGEVFGMLGGFQTEAAYGEDHLLVWRARQSNVVLRCVGAGLTTSARKYAEHGWLQTTVRHGVLTVKQAFPEWIKLITKDHR